MRFEISFDDGHKLDKKVVKYLDKYGLKALFFITVDYTNREDYLDFDQVREVAKKHEIGSHTVTHPADLKKLSYEEKWFEIVNSKDILEAATGIPVRHFCYPRGRYDSTCVELVRQANYLTARTTGVLRTDYEKRLQKPTTIHLFQRKEYEGAEMGKVAKRYFDRALSSQSYFHIWGHSWEIEKYGLWETFDKLLKYFAGKL